MRDTVSEANIAGSGAGYAPPFLCFSPPRADTAADKGRASEFVSTLSRELSPPPLSRLEAFASLAECASAAPEDTDGNARLPFPGDTDMGCDMAPAWDPCAIV